MEPNEGANTDTPQPAHPAPDPGHAAVPAKRKRGLAIWVLCAAAVLIAIGIYSGIHSRVAADSALANVVAETSVRSVHVTYPRTGERRQTVDLPVRVALNLTCPEEVCQVSLMLGLLARSWPEPP